MRQAGRSLPEYRELRVGTDMLEACLTPELASEITLQPVRRHGVDAAIFFSDIVIPVKLAGVDVRIVAGRGPVLEQPGAQRRRMSAALPPLDPAALDPIREAVAATVAELGDTPLIGFAGAPYTLASYLVEGGPSKEQLRTRALMHSDPATWAALLELVRRGHRRVPRRPDRGRRVGRAALRLVGGLAEPRRLHRRTSRRTRRAALAAGSRARRAARALRRRHRRAARRDARMSAPT